MTKIIVPIMPKSLSDISQLKEKDFEGADIIEWRADYIEFPKKIIELAPAIFEKLAGFDIMFTLRTSKEGGKIEIKESNYIKLLTKMASYAPSYIDIEYFSYPDALSSIRKKVDKSTKIVLSHHDFTKIPDDAGKKIEKMLAENVDTVKFAGMPKSKLDVLNLMTLNRRLVDKFKDRNIVTVAMGTMGELSRISGSLSGSAWTFAALREDMKSSPGQLTLHQIKKIFKNL